MAIRCNGMKNTVLLALFAGLLALSLPGCEDFSEGLHDAMSDETNIDELDGDTVANLKGVYLEKMNGRGNAVFILFPDGTADYYDDGGIYIKGALWKYKDKTLRWVNLEENKWVSAKIDADKDVKKLVFNAAGWDWEDRRFKKVAYTPEHYKKKDVLSAFYGPRKSEDFSGKTYEIVEDYFKDAGFTDIKLVKKKSEGDGSRNREVESVSVGG